MDDFKEENTEKESVQYRKPISYSHEEGKSSFPRKGHDSLITL